MLTARRGEGVLLEEGSIVFANGQVSQARAGRRRGAEALNWLSTWESCHCVFVPAGDGVQANQAPQSAQGRAAATNGHAPLTPNPLRTTPQAPLPPSLMEENRWAGVPTFSAPYPTRPLDEGVRLIEQYGLSRTHCQLFYLVDGRRSIVDLVRLMRKRGSEIYELLGDLERVRVIRIK